RLIKQQNAEHLNNCGIFTPKILDVQLKDEDILEIQERAEGEVLFYTNESNILNLFGDKEMKYKHVSFKDMSEDYRNEFCSNLMQYNLNTQKKLKSAPIEHFIKFLSDFKSIVEYGIDLDKHGENFLYDAKKGFSFIDLPPMQSSPNKKYSMENIEDVDLVFKSQKEKQVGKYREIPDGKILYDACLLFADALKYAGNIHNEDLINKARKNNTAIIEKIFLASKRANFKVSELEYNKIKELCRNFCYDSSSVKRLK
ncbi:MAG: hypothetical protein IJX26_02510, partial [Clostridia bacterium]|nr:hypothetical protein [Clostridia bacterium]